MAYLLLLCSIISEVIGSALLKVSNGFKKKWATLGFISGYGIAFYLLSLTLLDLPLGFAYAVWSGIGTVLTAMVGIFFFKETINKQGVIGILLLLFGVILLNLAN